jgi:uncharacterized membrane protein YqaE (UPF0057 family)
MATNEEDELDKKLRSKISDGNYTLFDKIMYGGLGYGYFCLPANLFKIIIAVLFPPFGIIIHNLGDVKTEFPYVGISNLISISDHILEFIISLLLTGLFYVPGLIYTFGKMKLDTFGKMKLNSDDSNTTNDKFKDTHKDTHKDTQQNNKDKRNNRNNQSNKTKQQSKKSSYNMHNTRENLDDIKKRLGID